MNVTQDGIDSDEYLAQMMENGEASPQDSPEEDVQLATLRMQMAHARELASIKASLKRIEAALADSRASG